MSKFNEIKPEELNKNAFQLIGKDWMLITAGKDDKVNTMTAAWGGFGVMFGKNVTYIVIRPQRYTKEFVDNSSTFSLSFLDNSFRKQLNYLGTTSGRDEDKISNSNLSIDHDNDTPYIKEANLVIICRKLYAQDFSSEYFIHTELDEKLYPNKDYHTLYISEIEKILIEK
ncbi:flavin reductase [Clostridium kluyveri]|uniref:Flavin reductase n=1 Tax=Clostridium kluyveri TaxID=1534 RepID=A0A1L5FAT1_CLOKL|nr:flavin reductase [Clostridium kluyveri]APM40109.1 flavin reductase [Clostridium kluyveri]UZQ49651.1 flavin reductase [Clostridium kluyveri]